MVRQRFLLPDLPTGKAELLFANVVSIRWSGGVAVAIAGGRFSI